MVTLHVMGLFCFQLIFLEYVDFQKFIWLKIQG